MQIQHDLKFKKMSVKCVGYMNINKQTPSQNVDSKNILITNYRSQLF